MGNITTGLLEIFARKFAEKVDSLFVRKAAGKGLSSNDYTTAEKTKLGGVSAGAQVNKIESISVNGAEVSISEKNVNLEVLVATDLAAYYTSEQVDQKLSAIPKFSISVVSALPTSGISTTTVYLVKTSSTSQDLYTEYIYVNGKWEKLGTCTVDLSGYLTKASGLSGAQAKNAKTITFTRGDATTFDVTVSGTTYSEATQSKAGLMSAADKTKLDGMTEATEDDIDAIIAGTFE